MYLCGIIQRSSTNCTEFRHGVLASRCYQRPWNLSSAGARDGVEPPMKRIIWPLDSVTLLPRSSSGPQLTAVLCACYQGRRIASNALSRECLERRCEMRSARPSTPGLTNTRFASIRTGLFWCGGSTPNGTANLSTRPHPIELCPGEQDRSMRIVPFQGLKLRLCVPEYYASVATKALVVDLHA